MAREGSLQGSLAELCFKCPVCFRKISSRASLLRHVQTIHETRQIFPCRVCHLSFKRKYDLSRHSRIHDTIRQFLCDTCGRGFSRKDNLNLHRRQKHGIGKAHPYPGPHQGQGQGQMWPPRPQDQLGGDQSMHQDDVFEGDSQRHFVGGHGPTAQNPDPITYNPLSTPSQNRLQPDVASFNLPGEPSGPSNVVSPEVDIHETKPQISQLLDAAGPVSSPQLRQPGARNTAGPVYRPTFAQQRVARAQQVHHGRAQIGGRGGMVSRPVHHQQQPRMPTPSSTVTSSAPPLKRPRLDAPRPAQQISSGRPMGQASFQRQAPFQSQSQMSAPRNAIGSPPRPMGQSQSRPMVRPLPPRPVIRSPPEAVSRPSQTMNPTVPRVAKNDALERSFLNPDHSAHIMTELSALWKSGKFLDAAILVGGMKLQAHRMVLFAASPYLRTSFDHLNPATELRLKMPSDVKLDVVFQFLTYIYDGVLKLNQNNVMSLLKISLMLQMEHLTACCREFIAQAVKMGTMSKHQEQRVETPLLVLMDQRAPDMGHAKSDMCTQTVSDSSKSQPRLQSTSRVDFERVFGEEDSMRNSDHSHTVSYGSVQSDVDLYRDYGTDGFGQGDDGGGGGTAVQTSNDDEEEEDATPMMIIKNEFIDPEYEMSLNAHHTSSPAADCDNISTSPNQNEARSEYDTATLPSDPSSDVPDTVCIAGSETMQVVPGIDVDTSSQSSSELPDHHPDRSPNDRVPLTPGEEDTTPHPETNLAASLDASCTSSVESNFSHGQTFVNRTTDTSHDESSGIVDNSMTFTPSGPDQSEALEGSGDQATPQFGTEEFLSSDFDVQMTKSEPKDPM